MRRIPRSTKVNIFCRASGDSRKRKHASEITASHVRAGCWIAANWVAAHLCHWSSRSREPTSGPVSRMASITTVTSEGLLGLAALNGTHHVAHCLGKTHGLRFRRTKDEIVASAVSYLDFLSGKRSSAKVGKPASEFTNCN